MIMGCIEEEEDAFTCLEIDEVTQALERHPADVDDIVLDEVI